MKQDAVVDLVRDQLVPGFRTELAGLDRIDRWVQGKQPLPRLPRGSTPEHRYLAKTSRSPWLRLVVISAAQMLKAERVFSADRDVADMWRPWDRNLLPKRQVALHTAAIQYGTAYAVGTPGDTGAVLRPYSPREMYAVYADPSDDEWPMFALRVIPQPGGTFAYRVYDETSVYFLGEDSTGVHFIEERRHDLGVCPVVRYSPRLDLEGRAPGEVEPYISTADRITKTDYDRLLAQHFNSWKVRTATKLDEDATDEELAKVKLRLAHDNILTGTGDTEFGTLDETPLDGFNAAHDSDVESLAAVSQTPTTALSGKMVNVSADGLIEAKASAYAKRDEFQTTLGGSHVQLLRLASRIEGRVEDAEDYTARIGWADTDSRTLAGAVDALGKAAEMLGVPAVKLWPLIPGVDQTQATEWERYAEAHPSAEMVQAQALAGQMVPTV